MLSQEQVAEILLDIGAVSLSPNKPFRFVSGILSPIYADNRLLMGYPDKMGEIAGSFAYIINSEKIKIDIIGGVSTSGIPHAAWLSQKMNLPMIYVRSENKSHGKSKSIEGAFSKGSRVAVIEDLVSTGGSSLSAVRTIRKCDGKVPYCMTIFTYGMKKSKADFGRAKIPLHSLLTLDYLLDYATDSGIIKKDERDIVKDWVDNPEKWGEKYGFERKLKR